MSIYDSTPALEMPKAPDLLGQLGQLTQLQAARQQMAQQQQEAPLRLQQLQMGVQEQQQALKDQQVMSSSMQQWSRMPKPAATPSTSSPSASASASSLPDYDQLVEIAKQNGASFNAVQGLQKSILDMKDKASTIAKNDAQAGTSNANAIKTKNGMLIDSLSGIMNLPDDQLVPGLLSASQELSAKGLLDPQHVQMAQQLAQSGNPANIRQSLTNQIAGLGGYSKMLDDAQKKITLQHEQGKSDPTSMFYAPSDASVALGTAPGAQQIQASKARQAAVVAGADAAARMPYEMSLAAQKQALSQGDPNAAGQLLVNGDATLSELKARGATPSFISRALFAASRLSGGKFNAQQADAEFSVAKSPANVAFFGSAKSLTDKGGTLDQLAEAAKQIPNGQIPAFNTIADWEKAATGSGPIAKYAALALGVADDYSKVMGGGQGSDASRLQALNLVAANHSPAQRAGSIDGIRGAVTSQTNSRIGNNKTLQRMYGNPAAAAGATAAAPASHQFSLSAWQRANPTGDVNAAKAAAAQQGFQVVQ